MAEKKIQWHPGFVAAMELELAENREDLIYDREHNLNTKPLEIDLLVIKKEPGTRMANEIGEIFRGHNIIEYKSPRESLDIDVFYKTQAYAGLYKAYGNRVDERRAGDITVTIIRNGKLRELFRYFTNHGIRTEKAYPGIYHVHGAGMFPTQIIVSRELNERSHIWLKALSDRLKKQEMAALLERAGAMTEKKEQALADSILKVSARANRKIVEELRGGDSMSEFLLELMKPEIDRIVADAVAEAKAEAAKAAAATKAEAAKAAAATKAEAAKAVAKAKAETAKARAKAAATAKAKAATKAEAAKAAAKAEAAARKSIVCAVKCFRDLGASDQEIRRLLVENYELPPDEAEKYL